MVSAERPDKKGRGCTPWLLGGIVVIIVLAVAVSLFDREEGGNTSGQGSGSAAVAEERPPAAAHDELAPVVRDEPPAVAQNERPPVVQDQLPAVARDEPSPVAQDQSPALVHDEPSAATPELPPDAVPVPHVCTGDDYDRDEWSSYPPAPANAAPTWTKPHDAVHARAITHDHHVALRDAHVSGGCDWSAAMKDRFSSDRANLNPTAQSFNASKGSRTPDQLSGIAARIIDTAAEQCVYARQHRAVKQAWDLTLTATEQATVTAWLAGCGATSGEAEPEPAPVSAPAPASESNVRCDPSYPDVCIPPSPPDLDCGDIPHRRFRVVGNDPHRFDGRDQDGIGCEI